MNNILSEKEYQRFIIDKLVAENGYIERKNVKFDRNFAIDREMLFKFLDDTQPEAMAQIRKVYKDVTEDTVINFINTEITKAKSSLLSVLKHGVEIAGYKLDLMYTKPATTFNKDLLIKYNKNIFSVMEEGVRTVLYHDSACKFGYADGGIRFGSETRRIYDFRSLRREYGGRDNLQKDYRIKGQKSVAFLSATRREKAERIRFNETNRDNGGRAAFYPFLRVSDTGIVFRGRGTA